MSTTSVIVAVDAVLTLTQLALNIQQATQQIQSMVATAKSEGRDLTDAEVASIVGMRKSAMDRWNSL